MTMTTLKKYSFPALRVALRLTCVATCAAAFALPVFAQDAPPPAGAPMHDGRDNSARMLKHMTRELNLTPDQVSQIQAIQADESTKIQALQADSTDVGHGRHQQMKAIHEDQISRVRAVLTDDQKPKYDAMLQQMKQRQQEHRQQGGTQPTPPPSL